MLATRHALPIAWMIAAFAFPFQPAWAGVVDDEVAYLLEARLAAEQAIAAERAAGNKALADEMARQLPDVLEVVTEGPFEIGREFEPRTSSEIEAELQVRIEELAHFEEPKSETANAKEPFEEKIAAREAQIEKVELATARTVAHLERMAEHFSNISERSAEAKIEKIEAKKIEKIEVKIDKLEDKIEKAQAKAEDKAEKAQAKAEDKAEKAEARAEAPVEPPPTAEPGDTNKKDDKDGKQK